MTTSYFYSTVTNISNNNNKDPPTKVLQALISSIKNPSCHAICYLRTKVDMSLSIDVTCQVSCIVTGIVATPCHHCDISLHRSLRSLQSWDHDPILSCCKVPLLLSSRFYSNFSPEYFLKKLDSNRRKYSHISYKS